MSQHRGDSTKVLGHSPRVDVRQSEDEHGRWQDERSDVEWKERIESGTKEIKGIILQVPLPIRPSHKSTPRMEPAAARTESSREQQWYGNEECDPDRFRTRRP